MTYAQRTCFAGAQYPATSRLHRSFSSSSPPAAARVGPDGGWHALGAACQRAPGFLSFVGGRPSKPGGKRLGLVLAAGVEPAPVPCARLPAAAEWGPSGGGEIARFLAGRV